MSESQFIPAVGQHIRWKEYRTSKAWRYGLVKSIADSLFTKVITVRRYQPAGAILGRYESHRLDDIRQLEPTDARLDNFSESAGYTKYGTPAVDK